MIKSLITVIFFGLTFSLSAQQTFQITNGIKSRTVKQTDYFTFYLEDNLSNTSETNRIYEGYILSANQKNYEVKIFFEEYETHDKSSHEDSLVMERCSYKGSCDKVLTIHNDQLNMFQHNKSGNISTAKVLFSVGAVALISSAILEFNGDLFTTNGIPDVGKRRKAVIGCLGAGALSVGIGFDLVNPKKYRISEEKYGKKGGWFIK